MSEFYFASEYRNLGYFARSHGSDGQLLLISERNVVELSQAQPIIRFQNERGDLVPARIESVQKSESGPRSFYVKLQRVDNQHEAERLKGKTVYMEEEVLNTHDDAAGSVPYDQFHVYDENDQPFGTVVNGFDTSAQQIIEVETEDGEQVLVPNVDEFVRKIDEENARLYCRHLAMLKDL